MKITYLKPYNGQQPGKVVDTEVVGMSTGTAQHLIDRRIAIEVGRECAALQQPETASLSGPRKRKAG